MSPTKGQQRSVIYKFELCLLNFLCLSSLLARIHPDALKCMWVCVCFQLCPFIPKEGRLLGVFRLGTEHSCRVEESECVSKGDHDSSKDACECSQSRCFTWAPESSAWQSNQKATPGKQLYACPRRIA